MKAAKLVTYLEYYPFSSKFKFYFISCLQMKAAIKMAFLENTLPLNVIK
jgi:hypothetical protein